MLPKIKKTVKKFLMDETGNISKSNIIKGALYLSAISATVKKVKGTHVGTSAECGSPAGKELPASDLTDWDCSVQIESHVGKKCKWVCSPSSDKCNRNSHTNNGSGTVYAHKNKEHSNDVNLEHNTANLKEIKTTHNHHGVHMNFNQMVNAHHGNHCSHSSGGGGWW